MITLQDALENFTEYVAGVMAPLIPKCYNHFEKLEQGNKNTMLIIPQGHKITGGRFNFNVRIMISIFDKTPDEIIASMLNADELLSQALEDAQGSATGIPAISEDEVTYWPPGLTAPTLGILMADVTLVLEYIDDCS
jgi:hypothetical protein